MSSLLFSHASQLAIESFIHKPSHALLLVAPVGSGKGATSHYIASKLLNVDEIKLPIHPYFKLVRSIKGKKISIDDIRDIIHFVTLRPVGATPRRIAIIEDSHLMTKHAQNALLKTIEEPPEDTTIILTATSESLIIPTIRSRSQKIQLQPADNLTVNAYYESKGYTRPAVETALLMSGGMPGLMTALLAADTSHPLMAAAKTAREILQKTTFERIALSDSLSQQRQLWLDTLFILAQMAHVAIMRNAANLHVVKRWEKVLAATYKANTNIQANAQIKLVVLSFMLDLQADIITE